MNRSHRYDDRNAYDQRGEGFLRVFDVDGDPATADIIDIGAVEYGIGDSTGALAVVDVSIGGSNSKHDDYRFSVAFEKERTNSRLCLWMGLTRSKLCFPNGSKFLNETYVFTGITQESFTRTIGILSVSTPTPLLLTGSLMIRKSMARTL